MGCGRRGTRPHLEPVGAPCEQVERRLVAHPPLLALQNLPVPPPGKLERRRRIPQEQRPGVEIHRRVALAAALPAEAAWEVARRGWHELVRGGDGDGAKGVEGAPLLVVWDLDAVAGNQDVGQGEGPPLEVLPGVAEPAGTRRRAQRREPAGGGGLRT